MMPAASANPSRWYSWEFIFYYVLVVVVYGDMLRELLFMSSGRLSKGWLFERKVDNSDAQYASFRNQIPLLAAAMLGYLLVSWLVRQGSSNNYRSIHWKIFSLFFSLSYLTVLHGTSVVKIVIILAGNFGLSRLLPVHSQWYPLIIWTYGIAILFSNEIFEGYSFASIAGFLGPLDSYRGLIPRWQINFNFNLLRMISFSMDYFWMKQSHINRRHTYAHVSCHQCATGVKCDKMRNESPCDESDYSFFNYLTYCLYTPLYLAGPIINFNNFVSQVNAPKPYNLKHVTSYALRFCLILVLMESMMRCMYVVSMSKVPATWPLLTPYQLTLFSYWNLKFIWLKLMIMWRFFRLWSIADGIDVIENMQRCMSNNYSPIGFWRGWHCSYNRWLIRYIYVPLGGSKHRALNTLLVFTFVAVWHDLQLRLLIWGWLISLFILPEILASKVIPRSWSQQWWYRHLCAFGGALNIIGMVAANLVGFSIGWEGMKNVFAKMFSLENPLLPVGIVFCTFVATQLMFEVREEENRQKIKEI